MNTIRTKPSNSEKSKGTTLLGVLFLALLTTFMMCLFAGALVWWLLPVVTGGFGFGFWQSVLLVYLLKVSTAVIPSNQTNKEKT